MAKTALVIIDVQAGMLDNRIYCKDAFLAALQTLLETAREADIPVVYIRHGDKDGRFAPGNPDWHIAVEIAPLAGEPIVDKAYNSAFFKTGLKQLLDGLGVDTLILAGMMTEYCFDATLKSAFEKEYALVVPAEANTTRFNADIPVETLHHFYNRVIWDKRFASVVST